MRVAAWAATPPESGCASRSRRRKRRLTSSRSTSIPAAEPEHLHRPPLLGGDAAPRFLLGRRARRPRPRPRERRRHRRLAVAQLAQLDVGGEPGPPAVDHTPDRVEHHTAARRREGGRGHDRAEHLRRRRPVPVELDDELSVLAEHAVPRPVEPVHVVLQPVAQRDARDRQAVARLVEQPRQQLALLFGDEGQAGRDERRDQGGTVPPGRTSAGRRGRARRDGSACADGCGGRSARRAAQGSLEIASAGSSVLCILADEAVACRAGAHARETLSDAVGSAGPGDDERAPAPRPRQHERDHPEPPRASTRRRVLQTAVRAAGSPSGVDRAHTVQCSAPSARRVVAFTPMPAARARRHRRCCGAASPGSSGPTPPSRGVIQPATSAHASSTSGTTRRPSIVMPAPTTAAPGFTMSGRMMLGRSRGRDEDVGLLRVLGQEVRYRCGSA